jgi:hypothetical protein
MRRSPSFNQFLPQHIDRVRCLDPDADLVALDSQHHDLQGGLGEEFANGHVRVNVGFQPEPDRLLGGG